MAQFSYKARRRSGEVVTGVLDVPDRGAALSQIDRLGLFPIAVEAPKSGTATTAEHPGGDKSSGRLAVFLPPGVRDYFNRQRKPKLQELATFTQQLANLIKSGMPLTVALNSMTHLETKGIPSDVSRDLKQDVMEGKGLSEAMAKQPRDLFQSLHQHGQSRRAERRPGRCAAPHGRPLREICPSAIEVHLGPDLPRLRLLRWDRSSCIFFMTYMLPKFMTIFEGMNVPLPLTTHILIGISHFMSHWWWADPGRHCGRGRGVQTGFSCHRPRAGSPVDRLEDERPHLGQSR